MIKNIDLKVRICSDTGKGRSFVIIFERGHYSSFATSLSTVVAEKARVVLLEVDLITKSNWPLLSEEVQARLKELSIRQASFIGFGAAGSLVQNIYLLQPRLIRTVVLIDASTRPHPDFFTRVTERLERTLPLGLPLRKHQKGFDSKPFLHRIRCPTLIVKSSQSTVYQRSEAEVLSSGLPTSWLLSLESENEVNELEEHVSLFQDVPAKRPQKNLRG